MRVLDPGHRYALTNLESDSETILQFCKDPALHDGDGYPGPTCQEVLRAVIDRVQELDGERGDVENAIILHDLRHAIAAFEGRALRRRVEKEGLAIELIPLAADGHLLFASCDRSGEAGETTKIGSTEGESAVTEGQTPNPGSTPETGLVEAQVELVARTLAKADGKDPDDFAWVQGYGAREQKWGVCWRDQYAAKAEAVLAALSNVLPDEV